MNELDQMERKFATMKSMTRLLGREEKRQPRNSFPPEGSGWELQQTGPATPAYTLPPGK